MSSIHYLLRDKKMKLPAKTPKFLETAKIRCLYMGLIFISNQDKFVGQKKNHKPLSSMRDVKMLLFTIDDILFKLDRCDYEHHN